MQRIVLAYSGGLHTSVSIAWLREQYDADVIAVTLDLGQGRDLTDIRERALAIGAARAHVLDAREEFARDFCLPALQAGALYEHRYPLSTSLGRPLIAKHLVQIAQMEGASAIAHGCTGKGNDQVRLDVSARALHPGIAVIAPVRIWELSRTEEVAYARARNIPVPASIDLPYSIDTNLWGRSIACGQLEDPWLEPPEDVYRLTRPFEKCSNVPAYVEVEFERGVPTKINSVAMGLLELISLLHTIAGDHGVGRLDMVENRVIGIKSREVYEAPAGVVLHAARQALLMMVSTRELERTVSQLATTYADLVYNGFWFTPLRAALDAFTASVQDRMTGVIRLKLFKGHCTVVGRRSPYALYDHALSTYGADDQFDHDAAEGFIRIYGLPAETAARKAPAVVEPRGGEEVIVSTPLWSGRFDAAPDADVFAWGASFGFDRRLFEDDVVGSLAYAEALLGAGVLGAAEAAAIREALQALLEAAATDPAFVDGPDEDVHSFVERQLIARVGDAGKRLHTGRSRNEQVSLDLRLYVRRRIPALQQQLLRLIAACLDQAERSGGALMPSYTHLRRAQPILVAHYWLAHASALRRDYVRLGQARDEAGQMPLGSGAIAGTAYAIDTAALAERLGFDGVVTNSLDATSDRDFVAVFIHSCALAMVHLSRLAEDIIVFGSEEFAFFELDDSISTGSSLMPQKKNPDPLELMRGKAGRAIGLSTAILATMKGLPAGYNKDLQEDKVALFDAEDTLVGCVRAATAVVATLRIRPDAMARAASGLLLATDVADYLVGKGMPFRSAHELVGAMVRSLVESGRDFSTLSLAEWRAFSDLFAADVQSAVTPAASVARKQTPQSTHPAAVASALTAFRAWSAPLIGV